MGTSLAGALHRYLPFGLPRLPNAEQTTSLIGVCALALWVNAVMLDKPSDGAADRSAGVPSARPETDVRSAEAMFAGYGGVSFTHASDVHFTNPGVTDLTAHDVNWIGRPFKSPIYYGLRAVRWSGASPFGAMLDFTHAKAIAEPEQQLRFSGTRNGQPASPSAKVREAFKHFEFSHGHNLLTLNGLARLLPLSPFLQPYVGGGFGVSLPHTEIQFTDDPSRTYEYQYTGGAGQAVAGIEIRLPRISLFVEYKFTLARYDVPLSGRNNQNSFGYSDFFVQALAWWRGEKPKYGFLKTWLGTQHLIGGVGVRTTGAAALPSL